MIKLFKETDTVYKTNGEVVINATKCRVYNEDGGEFKLTLTCPISYSKYIENNYIIVVPTPAGEQPFRIYEIEKSQNKIDITARHITYDSMDYVIPDSYAVDKTCGEAMEHFNNATDNPSPFSVYSDIEEINTLRIVRKSLYEAINEVNERWGGHIVRDMFSISNLSQIGRDNGITIEYRKNLQSITATYDFSGVCTKLLPVGRDGTLLDTLYVYSPVQYDIPHTKVVDFEQDIEKDDYPSEEAYIAALKADLLAKATDYVNTYCYPSVNYSLKGKPEKVTDIGDVIKVKDERLGIDILTQVISYEFDCITETYKSLEFGNFTDSLSNLMSNISTSTNETVNKAIQNLPQQNEATEEKSGLMSASDKTKLDGIEAGAQKNVQADWDETDPSADSYIKNKPSSLGDVTGVKGNAETNFRTGNVNLTPANLGLEVKQASQGGTDESLVTTGEKYTYLHVADGKADNTPTFTEASTRANLAGSGETMPTILGKIKKFFSDLKAVAFSGSYNDLADKPTIPAAQVNSDWNATSGVAQILNKPNLAAVATSGSYADLTGTPTIPTVNNSTITIKKNGTTVDSFTLNQSTGKDIDISVPTKTSDLTNDSGYITSYTDEKVTAEDANPSSDKGYLALCVPVLSATTNQKPKAPSGYMLSIKNGTSSAVGHAFIRLGNDKASGSANNKCGKIRLYSQKTKYVDLVTTANMTTADRTITLPDADGTIALTSNIPTKTSDLTNDSGFVTTDEIVEETDTTNSAPYLYRPTNGTGDRLYEKLVGASFGVNQLNNAGRSLKNTITDTRHSLNLFLRKNSSPWTSLLNVKTGSALNVNTIVSATETFTGIQLVHSGETRNVYFMDNNNITIVGGHKYYITMRIVSANPTSVNGADIEDFQYIDLTLMFGTDIADKAYTMEQSTAGSGIAWLKSYGFFTDNYYPYNAGELLSVKPTGKVNVGKNLLNPTQHEGTRVKTTNGITFFVNDDGSITCNGTATAQARYYFGTYSTVSYPFDIIFTCENGDTSKACGYLGNNITNGSPKTITAGTQLGTYFVYVPSGATVNNYTIKPMFRVADVTDTTYEPYTEYTYHITTELRGVAKLVGDDIVYDGDVDDGKERVRKYLEPIDLGSLNWGYVSSESRFYASVSGIKSYAYSALANLICQKYTTVIWNSAGGKDKVIFSAGGYISVKDSAYTDATIFKNSLSGVYFTAEKATPTTEPSNGFTMPQIVDKDGTEQFIDERTVPIPVGHDSEYVDLPNWMEHGYYNDFRNRVDYPNDSGWKELSISTSYAAAGSVILYRKRNEVVEVILNIQAYTTPLDTDTIIGTLPVGYRPKIRIASASYENGSSANYLLIYPNGEVVLHRNVSYLGFNMMFFNA